MYNRARQQKEEELWQAQIRERKDSRLAAKITLREREWREEMIKKEQEEERRKLREQSNSHTYLTGCANGCGAMICVGGKPGLECVFNTHHLCKKCGHFDKKIQKCKKLVSAQRAQTVNKKFSTFLF